MATHAKVSLNTFHVGLETQFIPKLYSTLSDDVKMRSREPEPINKLQQREYGAG